MRIVQSGFPNAVALRGSAMSDEQEAGWKGREDALSRLANKVYVRVIGLGEEGTQPDHLSWKTIKRLIHRVSR